MKKETDHYEDIIDRYPGPIPGHPPMSNYDRAAQFAPFAALTGFGAVIAESGRITEEWKAPDESTLENLDHMLAGILHDEPGAQTEIIWFKEDIRKTGGSYVTMIGSIRKADRFRKKLIVLNEEGQDEEIPFERIVSVRRADTDTM